MKKLTRDDLWSLEQYALERGSFRSQVIDHKKQRRIALGEHATLLFEDELTMRYQVQEMLRIERVFEPHLIEEEIEAYNPLIPDGSNWKATLLIEYGDPDERDAALHRMPGVEHQVWFSVGDGERRFVHANDDLDRTDRDKTAAVHFLRFELTASDIEGVKTGAIVAMGIDHPELPYAVQLSPQSAASLAADLD